MQTLRENKQSEMAYRLPSVSEEILCILLNEPDLFEEYKNRLDKYMFQSYAWVYETMQELAEQNSLTYKAVLLQHYDRLDELEELKNQLVAAGRMPYLIDKLKKEHLASSLYQIASTATMELMENGRDPNEVLAELQHSVENISNTDAMDLHDTDRDVDDYFAWMEEIMQDPSKAYGMMTGIEEIDRITTGFHRGDFIAVGARTSIGKSAFQVELALRLMKNGHKVGIYSLEMSKKQIYHRMLANLMTMDLKVLKTGRMPQARLEEFRKHKQSLKQIYVDDTRGISADYIVDSMKRVKRTRGLDVVMVDYLQDVKEQGEQNDNSGSSIARICRKLRAGAQICDVSLFGLSQVKREVELQKDKRPMPSDLAGSTGIETAADVIIMLYREDYYNPDTDKKGIMEVNFAKQRNGELGMVEMYYAKNCQQIRPLSAGRY